MYRFYFISLICFLALPNLHSQNALDQYVRQAIEQNLSVKEKQSLERKQQMAYEHAGKFSGPEVNFITNYTLAGGGRNIGLPLGDLLNEAYLTLNQLTGTQKFFTIENQKPLEICGECAGSSYKVYTFSERCKLYTNGLLFVTKGLAFYSK